MKLERDKWFNALTVRRCTTPFFVNRWFHPIQVRLNIVKDFVNMMAFMFYSYLAVDISWKIFKTIFFITKEKQIISPSSKKPSGDQWLKVTLTKHSGTMCLKIIL